MSAPLLPNYLRGNRKRVGLSQEDVAFLLGCQSGTKVSRYERFTREPALATVFACCVVFQLPAQALFSGTYLRANTLVRARAEKLIDRLSKRADCRAFQRKIAALRAILEESTEDHDARRV